jgi:light-regulated signal transduction histidine kinase (bacteriophytochrome)
MSDNNLRQSLAEAQQTIRAMQEELAETNRGLLALTLELEQRVDERTRDLRIAHAELQKTNSEVLQATLELQAANRELEAFAYSVSHDLRAPLRSIDGFSKALIEDYGDKLDSQAHEYLNRVRASTQHMGRLIDDLLKLSRITRSELVRETVDLSGLARAIAGDLARSDPERIVRVAIADDLVANGDRRLLRVLLENLLNNAWKFTKKKNLAEIEFAEHNQVYFVRDNGAGFDMTYAGKLFGAFQRLHSAADYPGTGIGLATVKRIVDRHGGRIWAESAVDQGATFFFTL